MFEIDIENIKSNFNYLRINFKHIILIRESSPFYFVLV